MTEEAPSIPRHVAIIPDGNRRWALRKGLTTAEGHKAGYDNLMKIADHAFAQGIEVVSGYVFSTENWQRTEDEVGHLMKMASWAIGHQVKTYMQKGIRIKIVGSRQGLDAKLAAGLDDVEQQTASNTNGTIGIFFNYGGRRDIIEEFWVTAFHP